MTIVKSRTLLMLRLSLNALMKMVGYPHEACIHLFMFQSNMLQCRNAVKLLRNESTFANSCILLYKYRYTFTFGSKYRIHDTYIPTYLNNRNDVGDMVMAYKIAVIEDDHAVQLMYKFKLEHEGYDVAVAANGEEGLELIERFSPSLILLDLHMPIMGGAEMLAKLRALDWGSDIRVIILANTSKNEAPQSLRLLRVDRYIEKAHSTPAQVMTIIREVISSAA